MTPLCLQIAFAEFGYGRSSDGAALAAAAAAALRLTLTSGGALGYRTRHQVQFTYIRITIYSQLPLTLSLAHHSQLPSHSRALGYRTRHQAEAKAQLVLWVQRVGVDVDDDDTVTCPVCEQMSKVIELLDHAEAKARAKADQGDRDYHRDHERGLI